MRRFTLPNVLSLLRLPLAASFPLTNERFMRAAIVLVAWITDWLDGFLARRHGMASRLGAVVDPVTDKLFALVVLGTFLMEGALQPWQLGVLLSRDVFNSFGAAVIWLRRLPVQMRARWSGKTVTGLQHLVVPFILFLPRWTVPVVLLVAVASVWAIVDYSLAVTRSLQHAGTHA